jgi:hypothetical protein
MLLLVNSFNKEVDESKIPNKLTHDMVKEHTSIFTVEDCEDYNNSIQELPNYDPVTWKGVAPYYQIISKPDGLWDVISVISITEEVCRFGPLMDITAEEVVDFFSHLNIKEVIVF